MIKPPISRMGGKSKLRNKIIKYHTPEIKRLLEYEFSGRDIFEEYKNTTLEHLTDIHRAIRFLYLINNSFAGKGKHFGYGTTKIPNQKIFLTEYLNEIKERLNNTYVENLYFEKIIDKYDREESLFFVIHLILKLLDMIMNLQKMIIYY